MKSSDILYHITVACKPAELVETTRGQVPYDQWLREEKARIENKSQWPVAIYTNLKTGEISLVHLRVKERA